MKGKKPFTINSFYEYVSEGILMGTKCNECNKLFIPLRPICTSCQNNKLEWYRFQGLGYLETYTIIHVASPVLSEKTPYIVGLVRLKEGPIIMSRILIDPKKIKEFDSLMELKLEKLEEKEGAVVAFKPI